MSLLQAWLLVTALSAPGDVELVEFSATWCGPCRAMEPVLDEAQSRGLQVTKVDVDAQPEMAKKYGVTQVPTTLIVAQGQVVDTITGAVSADVLWNRIERAAPHDVAPDPIESRLPPPRREVPPATSARGPARSAKTNETASIEQRALQASVRLRVEDPQGNSFGSGTIIDVHGPDALILTCGHIFRDSQGKGRIAVDLFTAQGEETLEGQLIRFDLERDLALVGVRTSTPIIPIPIARPETRVARGTQIFSVGCNRGSQPTVLRGALHAENQYLGPENFTMEGVPIDGRSGGGLFSYDGRLIGVCNAADPERSEGLYAAFPSIHKHLDDAKLSFVYQGGAEPATVAAQPRAARPRAERDVAVAAHHEEPRASEAADREALVDQLQHLQSQGAEVICIVRPRTTADAKSQVIVLDRPSHAFLDQLQQERSVQQQRQMTQLRVDKKKATRPAK